MISKRMRRMVRLSIYRDGGGGGEEKQMVKRLEN